MACNEYNDKGYRWNYFVFDFSFVSFHESNEKKKSKLQQLDNKPILNLSRILLPFNFFSNLHWPFPHAVCCYFSFPHLIISFLFLLAFFSLPFYLMPIPICFCSIVAIDCMFVFNEDLTWKLLFCKLFDCFLLFHFTLFFFPLKLSFRGRASFFNPITCIVFDALRIA